jgi:trans-L-3-hydroxyproline dehydratase
MSIPDWNPPQRYRRITTIDAHAAGEPLRVVTGGIPAPAGRSMLERRRFARERLDPWRRALMWEPRGHADMYGCLLTPPVSPGADLGVLFMHNEGFSTMCGHGIIALVTVLLETGMRPIGAPETTLRIDTPAGLIRAVARIEGQRVASVAFDNVPSFVLALDQTVQVPELGAVRYDLAFGGAFYAYVSAPPLALECIPERLGELIYGTIFIAPAPDGGAHSRNVCIFGDGEADRSPTGTGVSGRLAIHHARRELGLEQPIVIESILGSRFRGWIASESNVGTHPAVIPVVEGSAQITGRHEFLLDPADQLGQGFLLR